MTGKEYAEEYLASNDWKRKRNTRIMADKVCQICGRPFDLNVHHMTYNNVPHERMSDLITVCRNCHLKIEKRKPAPWYDSFHIVNDLIAIQFCKENLANDLSGKGKYDFCKIQTIKECFLPYLKAHGGTLDQPRTNTIQAFFRNRRYEIILDYLDKGYPEYICYNQTLFSRNMIHKVYTNPTTARKLLKEEQYNAET